MLIDRLLGPAKGRSLASIHNGLVYAVSYDPEASVGIKSQTRNALKFLDENLAKAGSAKTAIIQATVYLHDVSMKAEMDEVWNDWICSEENWPQRAGVGAVLDDGTTLIEIVVVAALI